MVEHSQELFAAGRSAVVWIIAALLPGAPPHADGKANTYQNYLVEHQQSLVGQAWLYSLAAALI